MKVLKVSETREWKRSVASRVKSRVPGSSLKVEKMALGLAQDVGASLSLKTLARMRLERSQWPGMLDGSMVALLTGATKWVADNQT